MIRLAGAAAAGERLTEIASAIDRNLAAAVAEEAVALQNEAGRRCPADTGALKNSIRATVNTRGAKAEAVIGSALDYAPAVELGALGRPPAPFLAPALYARRGALIERVRQAVRQAVEEGR